MQEGASTVAKKKPTASDIDNHNPKTLLGMLKPSISKAPASAVLYMALAFMDGARKYGPFNWRKKAVPASIYIDACKRHLDAWYDGEEYAEDSKLPHLAHALACIGIIVDAKECGVLLDDRPPPGAYSRLLKEWAAFLKAQSLAMDLQQPLGFQKPASSGKRASRKPRRRV
jgi:hypothetical protein